MQLKNLLIRYNIEGRNTACIKTIKPDDIGAQSGWTIKQLFDAVDNELSQYEGYIGIRGIEVVLLVE